MNLSELTIIQNLPENQRKAILELIDTKINNDMKEIIHAVEDWRIKAKHRFEAYSDAGEHRHTAFSSKRKYSYSLLGTRYHRKWSGSRYYHLFGYHTIGDDLHPPTPLKEGVSNPWTLSCWIPNIKYTGYQHVSSPASNSPFEGSPRERSMWRGMFWERSMWREEFRTVECLTLSIQNTNMLVHQHSIPPLKGVRGMFWRKPTRAEMWPEHIKIGRYITINN